VELLLVERMFLRSGLDYSFERAITFDPTIGLPPNFYRSFRTPFSLE
jgi:hypothetical protein